MIDIVSFSLFTCGICFGPFLFLIPLELLRPIATCYVEHENMRCKTLKILFYSVFDEIAREARQDIMIKY